MASVLAARIEASSFTGPLPPPDILAQYDQVLPGAAERILAMAEKQAVHRQDLEATVVKGDSRRASIGMYLGFGVAFTTIVTGACLVWHGDSTAGLTTALTPLAVLAGVFVYGQRSRREEREAHSRNASQSLPTQRGSSS